MTCTGGVSIGAPPLSLGVAMSNIWGGQLWFTDYKLLACIFDERSREVVADSDATADLKKVQAWLAGRDKEDRNERERAARRRPKLVTILHKAIIAMGTAKAEPAEIRELLLRFAVQAQVNINVESDDALLSEIEAADLDEDEDIGPNG